MNVGCAGKTVRSLENACHIPERLTGVFMTRCYTNPRLPYLTMKVTNSDAGKAVPVSTSSVLHTFAA